MKNISGKTLIFYTFQTKDKSAEYNVTTFKKTSPQEAKIRDVLFQLPLDYHSNSYHFRFRSQFFEGDQKIVGWIDISNLLAKVPMINNTIFVKILKLPGDENNKLFNREKLKAIALLEPLGQQQPQKQPNSKPLKTPVGQNGSLLDFDSPSKTRQLNVLKIAQSKKQAPRNQQVVTQQPQATFVPGSQTPQQRLKGFQQQNQYQQKQKQLQRAAARVHEAKLTQWGYSGHKTINNLTTLLATLHTIWPEWPAVSLSDMLKPQDVQKLHKKAVLKVHPDKNRRKQYQKQYLAKRIFQLLSQAKKTQS